jgi:hypothetical protein
VPKGKNSRDFKSGEVEAMQWVSLWFIIAVKENISNSTVKMWRSTIRPVVHFPVSLEKSR